MQIAEREYLLSSSAFINLRSAFRLAHVAQSVEHVLGKNGVIGSNPIVGSECRHWVAVAFFATVPKKGRRINALEWTRRCAQQEESIHG